MVDVQFANRMLKVVCMLFSCVCLWPIMESGFNIDIIMLYTEDGYPIRIITPFILTVTYVYSYEIIFLVPALNID